MRVAVGAVAKRLLAELDMEIANHVVVFGGKEIDVPENLTVAEIKERAAQSEGFYCQPRTGTGNQGLY